MRARRMEFNELVKLHAPNYTVLRIGRFKARANIARGGLFLKNKNTDDLLEITHVNAYHALEKSDHRVSLAGLSIPLSKPEIAI